MTSSTPSVKRTVAYYWKPMAIVTGLVAISAVAYNVSAVRTYFNLDSPKLVASVSAHDFKMPPTVLDQLETSSSKGAALAAEYSPLDSITTISIRNAGNLPAKNVRLKLETQGIAKIVRDQKESEPIEFETVLPIGDLPIEESAEVTLWTASTPPTVSVLHSTGADVLLLYREKSPPLWYWGFIIGVPSLLVALSLREKTKEAKTARAEVVRLQELEFARRQADLDERNAQLQTMMDKLDADLRRSLAKISLSFANGQPHHVEAPQN